MKNKYKIILAGGLVGILSAILVEMGNPGNMGVCVACFIRDIAGSLGFHSVEKLSYIRPEIIGIVLGAFIAAIISKEYKVKGGSAPFTRFALGALVIIGALVFLACPLRMILRIGGGDLNAIVGLAGFVVGILVGIFFLNKGFSLKRNYSLVKSDGYAFPLIMVLLLILLLVAPTFIVLGAGHAPIYLSLFAGLLVGLAAQRTRLCMVGGIRDAFLFKDFYLLSGFLSIFVFVLIGNLIFGNFNLGFEGQPVAHTDGIWNFLGMVVTGWGSVLLGGCPLRQLILSAEGNSDSIITVFGMFFGGAVAHNFGLASSPAGATAGGSVAVIVGLIILGTISFFNIQKSISFTKKEEIKA